MPDCRSSYNIIQNTLHRLPTAELCITLSKTDRHQLNLLIFFYKYWSDTPAVYLFEHIGFPERYRDFPCGKEKGTHLQTLIFYTLISRNEPNLHIFFNQELKSCICHLFYNHIDFMVFQHKTGIFNLVQKRRGWYLQSTMHHRCTLYNYI